MYLFPLKKRRLNVTKDLHLRTDIFRQESELTDNQHPDFSLADQRLLKNDQPRRRDLQRRRPAN